MLRKFRIKINDKEYLVEMEEIGAPQVAPVAVQPAPAQVAAAPAPQAAPAPAPVAPAPQATGEGLKVEAPMPGTILNIMVNVGDRVTVNQPLVVLEAMKMENEIVAPKAGVITSIGVTKGSPIDVGEVIVTIGD